ncbi:MAG: adenine-specific methyltransferase EcoRI family protein [Alistipes sp.]
MANNNLTGAKNAKKDEFYTQLDDIANELHHYRDFFRGKSVLCRDCRLMFSI